MGAGRAEAVGRRMHCAAVPAARPWATALQFAMINVITAYRRQANVLCSKISESLLSPGYSVALSVIKAKCEIILRNARELDVMTSVQVRVAYFRKSSKLR